MTKVCDFCKNIKARECVLCIICGKCVRGTEFRPVRIDCTEDENNEEATYIHVSCLRLRMTNLSDSAKKPFGDDFIYQVI